MSKWRRYLYLVMDRFDKGIYPLRRIDSSSLFFPANQPHATPSKVEDARLPQPCLSFTPTPCTDGTGSRNFDFFALFGRGERKKSLIAGADENGFTVMYDLDQRTVHNTLRLNEPKQIDPISLAVGDALYVMERRPHPDNRCNFESLVHSLDEPKPPMEEEEDDDDDLELEPTEDDDDDLGPIATEYDGISDWRWRCLEPPPYVLEPDYNPTRISAYTVVGGSNIWISTPDIGTYSFDTVAGKWSKAGKWLLPFRGRADYFPEYDSWLGFTAKSGLLCSFNLSNAASVRAKRLVVRSVLEEKEDMREGGGCMLSDAYLVHLGSGKFCVAKFFRKEYNLVTKECHVVPQLEEFVVFTGFVMDQDGPGGALRVTKHKSRRYATEAMTNGWVF
ncbi:unnamed protein product [Urochloa decumbens]|uniref:Uncharacterized protein n=1 Tax=Urochloa decumbens TaxID=240449 RepID=A0ABC8ZEH1_9POAL